MSSDGTSIGSRFKRYEEVTSPHLLTRCPVIVRVDGRAFHTLTRGLDKPWDRRFVACMHEVARALCRDIAGAKLAYVQSDEISVVMTDYDTLNTQPWFDYEVQKIASVAAGRATAAFGKAWRQYFGKVLDGDELLEKGADAHFDARVFNVPDHSEVVNYLVWRQRDAIRNSVQSLARSCMSDKACHGLDSLKLREVLARDYGVTWEKSPPHLQRGATVVRLESAKLVGPVVTFWSDWELDLEPPVFSENRGYVLDRMPQDETP